MLLGDVFSQEKNNPYLRVKSFEYIENIISEIDQLKVQYPVLEGINQVKIQEESRPPYNKGWSIGFRFKNNIREIDVAKDKIEDYLKNPQKYNNQPPRFPANSMQYIPNEMGGYIFFEIVNSREIYRDRYSFGGEFGEGMKSLKSGCVMAFSMEFGSKVPDQEILLEKIKTIFEKYSRLSEREAEAAKNYIPQADSKSEVLKDQNVSESSSNDVSSSPTSSKSVVSENATTVSYPKRSNWVPYAALLFLSLVGVVLFLRKRKE